MREQMQIGEVAEHTGLSLRTIRYYEEVGLVVPSARSQGGFRLYTEPDIDRLQLIKRMKPLGFQLEEMREVLAVLDPLPGNPPVDDPADQRSQPPHRVGGRHTTTQRRSGTKSSACTTSRRCSTGSS